MAMHNNNHQSVGNFNTNYLRICYTILEPDREVQILRLGKRIRIQYAKPITGGHVKLRNLHGIHNISRLYLFIYQLPQYWSYIQQKSYVRVESICRQNPYQLVIKGCHVRLLTSLAIIMRQGISLTSIRELHI